jgi:glycosyltransferase involved in cell wall biosynthesis
MSSNKGITIHCVVRNEERFVWYALMSVIEYVDKIIIFDTGSNDRTKTIIRKIESNKITFEEKGKVDRRGLIKLRQEQIDRTRTEWFYLLDGDEIYPVETIEKVVRRINRAEPNKVGLYLPFYNLVGDVYHKQKEKFGRYQIGPMKGHVTLRGVRRLKGLKVEGDYPLEAYVDKNGTKIQDYPDDDLIYVEKPFWHAGSLVRSSEDRKTMERKQVYDLGVKVLDKIPDVFLIKVPDGVERITERRSLQYALIARLYSWLREIKFALGF